MGLGIQLSPKQLSKGTKIKLLRTSMSSFGSIASISMTAIKDKEMTISIIVETVPEGSV
jgi:hypothetical protein